jgi:hypothetical protein
MSKRGISHVEAVVSFVFFIGFLLFAFFFFSPFSGSKVLNSSVDYVFREITEDTLIDLESYTVIINEESITETVEVPLNTVTDFESMGVRVMNGNGLINGNYGLNGENVYFDVPTERIVIIYFSDDFSTSSGGGILLDANQYEISSSDLRKVYSEKKIVELGLRYGSNYEGPNGLKEDFNIPKRVDFSYSINFNDGTSIGESIGIPAGIDVTAQTERIEIIRSNGNIEFANLITRVW